LTAHNICNADGISEDEREHLLEALQAIKASGEALTVDGAHKALEEVRAGPAACAAVSPSVSRSVVSVSQSVSQSSRDLM
jgi:hypothetical protein